MREICFSRTKEDNLLYYCLYSSMKKYFLLLVCLTLTSLASAAPVFQEPVLQKAYVEVQRRIENKSSTLSLSADAKNLLEKKQESIVSALVAIDRAWEKKDKTELRVQIGLFRSRLRDTMSFLETEARSSAAILPLTNDIQTKPADISYYSDIFE